MPRRLGTTPSPLSTLIAHLRASPKLSLPHITSLRLTLAARNDHFGARHFLKEQLPRIRFANPELEIHVQKMSKRPKDEWRPELQLSFRDGKTQTLSLHAKWSTTIVRELMDSAGSPAWARWKAEAARTGVPLLHGAEEEPSSLGETPEPRFSFEQWCAKHPPKARKASDTARGKARQQAKPKKELSPEAQALEDEKRKANKKAARQARLDAPRLAEEEAEKRVALELLAKPRTGAAAVLP